MGDSADLEAISRRELADRLARGDVVVLDVRPDAEYQAGHIPGARSVPPAERKREGHPVAAGHD